jgi:hypothetical protein
VIERGLSEASASTIWRWLHDDALKPWQQRSWIFVRDRRTPQRGPSTGSLTTAAPTPVRPRSGGCRSLDTRLIHLPIHASSLNQIELYFSIVQRKALTPNDFDSLETLAERLLSFSDRYRQIARPFDWTFTRTDLDRLLTRIDAHEPELRLAA